MMSYKAALAGLPYGGAKAVILQHGDLTPTQRKKLFRSYAEKVNYFAGRFITGTDVGMNQSDIKAMARVSPYFVGLKVDPTKYTAIGLFHSIKACLDEVYGSPEIRDRSFAIQGLGKIGYELLRQLYREGGRITVAEINIERLDAVKRAFPRIEITTPQLIHTQKVDVFSPCALNHSLTFKNISKLRCAMIVGGANNQLETDEVGELLNKLGILYAPDYVVNAGGLISVVDEYENKTFSADRLKRRIARVGENVKKILHQSRLQKKATNTIANDMAQKIFNAK